MKPSPQLTFQKTIWKALIILVGVLGCALLIWVRAAALPSELQPEAGKAAPFTQSSAEEQIRAAWKRLQAAGAYAVTADVEQITNPLATVQNVGKQSRHDTLHLDGTVDRVQNSMEMNLWSQGGSVLDPESGAQIKVDGERAYVRSNSGGWHEIQNFTGLFAPGGDFSVFLSSVKDARLVTPDSRADEAAGLTRFAFEVDGASLANRLHKEMERQMREDGELPPGIEVSIPGAYQQMTGAGEVWLNEAGFPVRQKITLVFPPQEDSWVEAVIDVSFASLEGVAGSSTQPAGLISSFNRWIAHGGSRQLTRGAITIAAVLLSALVFIQWGRRRVVQNAVAIAVIVSTIFSPLLQTVRAAEFVEDRRARAEQLQKSAEAPEMQQVVEDFQREQESAALPSQTALEAILADTGTDTDRDGLTDVQEAVMGTSPIEYDSTGLGLSDLQALTAYGLLEGELPESDPGTDTDGDGLTDYQETLLGTSSEPADRNLDGIPDGYDTDMDGVSDFDEVNGFEYNGKRWYTDPLNPDTNNDGLLDGTEWNIAGSAHATWDLDGDGIPDAFDLDNDGDGVIDQLDLSPYVAPVKTFTQDAPFTLAAGGLTPGKTTYVEFQFRPANSDQLRYAYNVLDWPYDTEGQIKDLDNATFYSVDTSLPAYPNDNGDMKLIPMLEIQTGSTASNLPLTETPPEVQLTLQDMTGSGIQGSITINQSGDDLVMQHTGLSGEGLEHAIYQGTCSEPSTPWIVYGVDSHGQAILGHRPLESVANGQYVIVVYPESEKLQGGYACAPLPNLPREGGKWVDIPLLNKYGISVIPQANGSKIVYAPVDLTVVSKTNEKVAFHAKMIYQPQTADWGAAHSIRLLWMVQALVDHCAGPDLSSCYLLNNPEIVQTYYADFKLTGLTVRENRGFDTAVIYEDPEVDQDIRYDDSLFLLSHVLERTFLAATDCDTVINVDGQDRCQGDGQADFTLAELKHRFDHATNAGVPEADRFELPNNLSVRTFNYDHPDLAMADMTGVQIPAILEEEFTQHNPGDLYPTLMTASQQRMRSLSLDAGLDASTPNVRWNGNSLTLSLAGVPEFTVAGLSWAPYRQPAGGAWENMPIQDYWNELGTRYAGDFAEEPDEDVRNGGLMVVRLYYLAMSQSVTRTIAIDGVNQPASHYEYERPMIFKAAFFVGKVGTFMVDRVWSACGRDFSTLAARTVQQFLGKLGPKLLQAAPGSSLIAKLYSSKASAAAKIGSGAVLIGAFLLAASAAVYTIVYMIAKGQKSPGWDVVVKVGDVLIAAGTVALTLGKTLAAILGPAISLAKTGVGLGQKFTNFCTSIYNTFNSMSTAIGNSMYANVITFIIQLGIIWGTFFYSWATGAVQLSSGTVGQLLALTIANTLIAVLFFLMSLTAVTTLIAAVITSVDAILTVLCDVFNVQGACFTITGKAAEIISRFYFSLAPTVALSKSTLGAVHDIDYQFLKPDMGYTAGNKVAIRATLHTTLEQDWVDGADWVRIAYNASQMITPEKLRQATVKYAINEQPPKTVAGEMANQWAVTANGGLRVEVQNAGIPFKDILEFAIYKADADYTTGPATVTLKAGINYKLPADLYISYALPAAECWGKHWASVCLERSITGKVEDKFPLGLTLDVFPTDLDTFYSLTWSDDFGVQKDFDGDGLINAAAGGLDQDDEVWDQDGDGISDGKEVELRRQGIGVFYEDPATGYDSDGDGLSDYEEIMLGTDPTQADTDRDGLTDPEEIDGWLWDYSDDGSLLTLVTSDPTIADTDGDSNLDRLERDLYQYDPVAYPFHPRKVDPVYVTLAAYVDDTDGYVGSAQVVNYTVVVGNTTPAASPLSFDGSVLTNKIQDPTLLDNLIVIADPKLELAEVKSGESVAHTTELSVFSGSMSDSAQVYLQSTTSANFFPPGQMASLQWVELGEETWTPVSDDVFIPRYAAVTPTTGWNAPFYMAGLESNPFDSTGTIQTYRTGESIDGLIDFGKTHHTHFADTPLAVACNGVGPHDPVNRQRCLVVWSEKETSEEPSFALVGQFVANSGGVMFQDKFTIADETCDEIQPAVTTDGVDFLVTWACGGDIHARAYASETGLPVSDPVQLNTLSGDDSKPSAWPAAAWTGNRYTVAWEQATTTANRDLYAVQLTAAADPIPGAAGALAATTLDESAPQIAYLPDTGDSLLVYLSPGTIEGTLLTDSSLDTANHTGVHIAGLDGANAVHQPKVAYDPRLDGWMVAWIADKPGTGPVARWQSVQADGELLDAKKEISYHGYSVNRAAISLACGELECVLLAYSNDPGERNYYYHRLAHKPTYPSMGTALANGPMVELIIDLDRPQLDSLAGIPESGFVKANSTLVIGGNASDTISGIEQVGVRLVPHGISPLEPRGEFDITDGHETWVYSLNVPAEGAYDLDLMVTDRAGNEFSNDSREILLADGTPPVVNSDLSDGAVLHLDQDEDGRFILPLSGMVGDPQVGIFSPNNTNLVVEALVSPGGTGWQPTSFIYGELWEDYLHLMRPWSLDYVLSPYNADGSPMVDPSGVYTVTLRATDEAGNTTAPENYVTFQVKVDHSAPVSTLEVPESDTVTTTEAIIDVTTVDEPITESITLSGAVTETGEAQSGIAVQEVRLRPVDTAVWPGLWSAAYANSSDPAPSLTRMDTDALGGGLDFDWGDGSPAEGIDPDGFTAAWQRLSAFRANGTYTLTIEKDADSTALVELDGVTVLSAPAGETVFSAQAPASAGLHNLSVRYTEATGDARLRFGITLEAADSVWTTAALAAAGQGVTATTWQYPLPDGLEGLYEIDLRATDVFENQFEGNPSRWRGEIDTAAPRLEVNTTYLGAGATARTFYRVWASDFNLSEEGWVSPCPLEPDDRISYNAQGWAELGGTPPDQTRLYQIYSECSVSGHVTEAPVVKACDLYGRCTEAASQPAAAPNKAVYLAAAGGELSRLNLDTGEIELLASAAGPSVAVYDRNGRVVFPAESGDLMRLNPGAAAPELIYAAETAGADYAVVDSNVYWPSPDGDGLYSVNLNGSGFTEISAAGLTGLAGNDAAGRLYGVGQVDGLGRITILDVRSGSQMTLVGADLDTNNAWAAERIAVDGGGRQFFLAGECGDPAGGPAGSTRDRIYGIHRLAIPAFQEGVVNGVTGCMPVVRIGDTYDLMDLAVDDRSGKLYYLLREKATGWSSLWRADLDGSDVERLYHPEQAVDAFAIDKTNLQPAAYPTSAYTTSDSSVEFLLHTEDLNDDPIIFTLVEEPQHGTLQDWPVGPASERTRVTYTPEPDFDGVETLTYRASDGRGGTATGTVQIWVNSTYMDISILSPAEGEILPLGEPLDVEVALRADQNIASLEIFDNGVRKKTEAFGAGVQETTYTYQFMPETAGVHTLVFKLHEAASPSNSIEANLTVYVSHEGPTVTIDPTITLADQPVWNGVIYFTGTASDSTGWRRVDVTVDGEPAGSSTTEPWQGWYRLPAPPDGETFEVTAVATDRLNATEEASETVLVDLVPPAAVLLTLGVEGGGAIEAGQTVRVSNPTLTIDWGTSTDGSDVEGYYAGWTDSPTPPEDPSELTRYTSAGEHAQPIAQDAVVRYAHLGIRDTLGNVRWQTAGPVYIDGPATPDLIGDEVLDTDPGHWFNWLGSGGSPVSADYTLTRINPQSNPVQRFYTTWDAENLALAWEGVLSGLQPHDLYIYLDTGLPGGAEEALDETAPFAQVRLPAVNGSPMSADYLIHVVDETTAHLRRWNGDDWETIAAANDPAYPGFRLLSRGNTNAAGVITNDTVAVKLPFDRIGIVDPDEASLAVVALLTDNLDLKIYAAAPDQNPLNAEYTLGPLARPTAWQPDQFALTQALHWDSLGLGQIPNGGTFADSDLRVWISAEPAGLAAGFLETDLYEQLVPGAWLDADLDGGPDVALPVSSPPPVGAGPVTYTVHYENLGSEAAQDVRLGLFYNGSLVDGPDSLNLGTIAPGAAGQQTFTALFDTTGNLAAGELRAVVSDAAHGAFDWYWVLHAHDTGAPSGVTIDYADPSNQPELSPGYHWSGGKASDPSGIAQVEVEVTYPSGTIVVFDGAPSDPMQPTWTIQWEASETGTVALRARALDQDGVWSDWTDPFTVVIDNAPRGLSLDEGLLTQLEDLQRGPEIEFFGTANKLDRVQICTSGAGGYACRWTNVNAGDGTWSVLVSGLYDDGTLETEYEINGYTNGMLAAPSITGAFRVDTQPPQIVYSCGAGQISLTDYWSGNPDLNPDPLVSGTVSDSSGVVASLTGSVINEAGETVSSEGFVWEDGAFTFTPRFDAAGSYDLVLETADGLGNEATRTACSVYVYPAQVDLSVKAASASETELFNTGPVDFSFIVANSDEYSAANVTLQLWGLPEDAPYTISPDTISCHQGGYADRDLICHLGNLEPGAETSFTLQMTIPVRESSSLLEVGGLVRSQEIDSDYSNNYLDIDIPLTSRSDMEIAVDGLETTEGDPIRVNPGEEIIYTIHVTNNGPSHGAEGSIVTVYWPVFGENLMEPVTADGEGWECSGISTITCNHAMQGGEYPPIEVSARVRSDAKPGVYSSDVKIHKGGWEDPDSENDTAVGSIEVNPFADLTLTKAVQSETDPVEPGAAIDYVLVVTNHGPADATGVTLTDSLPDGVSFLSGQGSGWSCSESDGTVTCTLDGALPARQLSTATISVMVEVSDTEISNSASVAAVEEDPDPSDNTSTEVVAVKSLADLSIDMAASDPVYPGETVTYTLQIANGGPDDIPVESGGNYYVEVEAELHPGTTVDWHQLGGKGWGCGIGESGEPHTVHCVRTGLPVGTAPEITIVATLPQTLDELHHTARVIPADYSYDANPENNTALLALTPVGRPDLVLQKEAPSYAKAGETITYTLTVANDGQVPAEQLTLSDSLPAALTYESFIDPNGSGWACEAAGQLVTCTLPGLAVDAQAEVRLVAQVSPTASGALVNTASVSSAGLPDMHPADNAASAETEVDPAVDLGVTLSNGTETAYLETDFTVLMSVTNYGPELADESTNTTFSWTGDATVAGAAGEGWSCDAGETVTCYRTTPLAVDETSVVTVTLRAHSADDVNQGVTSRATVVSDWHDPVDSNDSTEITTTIEPAVDLEVAKRATTERCMFLLDDPTCFPAPIVEPGGLLTYYVSVHNMSVIAAPDVTVADELPAGMIFQEFEDGETSCSHDAGVISCMLESLAAGEIFMLTYTASAPESEGPVSNTASVHTTLPDIDAGNDTDSADVRVIPLADLSVTQTVTPAVPVPMQPITFTIQVTNGGPYVAAVTLTDTLPGNATYLGATGDGWVCSDPVEDELTCTYDLLAVDETTTLDIGFRAGSQPGAIVNRVVVSGPNTADFEMADNDQEQKSIVYPTADLALIQTASTPVVDTGSALTYVLEVINNGPSSASGIVVTDVLPAGASFTAASSDFPGAACGQADGVVTCAINPARDVLLVDATGDEWDQWSVAWGYAQALDELGVSHTRIDAAANPPTAADLSQAPLVIWVLSPWSDGKLSTDDEANLAAYLDGGGRLWLVGSSAFSEPVTPFMRDYLGIASGEANIRVDSVSGENAFGGLGPYRLLTDHNLDRLTPTGEGQVAFAAELRSGGEDVPVGVYTDRTVFITFGWDEIYENSAEDGVAVLSAVLDHLTPVLPAGESALVTIQVRAPLAEGPFTNLAEVTAFTYDEDTNNNQAEIAVEAVKSSTPTGPFRYYLPWIMKESSFR